MELGANIRKLAPCALVVSSLLLAAGATPAAAQTKKPNVVMLMSDDMRGSGDYGVYFGGAGLGYRHAEHRSPGQGRRNVHELVRPG